MDTVIVSNSQFYSHFPRQIPKGSVNAEQVEIRLDKSWDGLTVFWHWENLGTGVEKRDLLKDPAAPNDIPWEVLTDLGELRMGLVGLDGETVIKPTLWLTYGYVSNGVDPEAGSDPKPPTPSWEQQMVEQARVAAKAAEEAKDAAVNAEKAASQAGPYADEAQKSAEVAKEAQRAASTSAQEAGDAKDQANTASNTAKDHADAAGTAKVAAERAAETAGNAQSDASQSAQVAANSAQAAERAKQEAQNAAAAFPAPSQEFAGMVPVVNPEGNGYVFVNAGSGGACGELQVADYEHQGNQEIHFSSIDWATGVCDCTEPHNLTEPKKVLIVPNNWWDGTNYVGAGVVHIPIEWIVYTGNSIYVVPVDETRVKITGADKTTIIPVDTEDVSNTNLDATKFHVEIPIGFIIKDIPVNAQTLRIFAFGFSGLLSYRYVQVLTDSMTGYAPRRVWPSGMLMAPRVGLSKCGYALPFWYDITVEAAANGTYFDISTLYLGQRQGYSTWIADKTKEDLSTQYATPSDNNAKWFTGIEIASIDACYANHTIFRLYAKAVKE